LSEQEAAKILFGQPLDKLERRKRQQTCATRGNKNTIQAKYATLISKKKSQH
jgi:hypothetical protein